MSLSKQNKVNGKYCSWNYSRYINKAEGKRCSFDCDVYLGNIPSDFTLSECRQLLNAFGRVAEIRLITGKLRFNRNKGYAFIKYFTPIMAEEASIQLNEMEVRPGVHLRAVLCRCQRRIVVEHIPIDKTDDEIFECLSSKLKYIINVRSMKPPKRNRENDGKQNIGFAFVEFETHAAAVKAVRILNVGGLQFWGRSFSASWMEPDKPHKRVIVTNVPLDISDQLLLNWLQGASNDGVIKYEWCQSHLQLEFRSNYQAELAIRKINGLEVNGSALKMYWDVLAK